MEEYKEAIRDNKMPIILLKQLDKPMIRIILLVGCIGIQIIVHYC